MNKSVVIRILLEYSRGKRENPESEDSPDTVRVHVYTVCPTCIHKKYAVFIVHTIQSMGTLLTHSGEF